MKFYSLIALLSTAVVAETEVSQVDAIKDQLDGAKSFYDGYYKAFYHANSNDETLANCMNDATIENMIQLGSIMKDPLSMFELKNMKSDMNLFGQTAEVAADLSECHFEQSFFDLWTMCTTDKEACAMPKLTENLTKNMFVFVGKLTQMGETLTEMKGVTDQAEHNEQMREMGSDCGTILRDMFAFKGQAPSRK